MGPRPHPLRRSARAHAGVTGMALARARAGRAHDERKGQPMTTPHADGNGPLIPRPELTLPALRQAVATVAPSRLPEFFEDLQKAFVRAGDEDSVVPIDRKSTRLNSSHGYISYAVFCLKKKKNPRQQ